MKSNNRTTGRARFFNIFVPAVILILFIALLAGAVYAALTDRLPWVEPQALATEEPIVTEAPATEAPVITEAPTEAPTEEPEPTPEPTPEPIATPVPTAAPTPEPTRDPALVLGMSGDYVASLQDRLMSLGYLDIDEPTSYYGSSTAYAVELFQRQHGLEMDGLAGQETLGLLFSQSAQKYMMMLNTQGLDVENLQKQLQSLGYYNGSADGYYGDSTRMAVEAFQQNNELEVNGIAGDETLSVLFSPEAVSAAGFATGEIESANIRVMIDTAFAQLGKRYVLGAVGPNTFDCSGLVYYCLKMAGSSRGRYDAAGYSMVSDWQKISSIDNVQIGDLLFFYNNSFTKVGHVGIYIGNGMMIDASSSNGKVVCRSCETYYWRLHFARARRPW